MEVDVIHLLATAEKTPESCKWRGGNFSEQVENRLPDQGADLELRIIEAASYGQVDVNNAVAILEERYRDFQRQVNSIGAFHTLAQFQLIDDDLVRRGQLAVFNFVFDVDGQLTLSIL